MPTLSHTNIPTPKSWDEFEDIVCSSAKNRWKNPDFTRHGRQGQTQSGVDIYGNNEQGELVGIQCKNTLRELTQELINNEVSMAGKFKPLLVKLYIATTSPTDQSIQEFTRQLSMDRGEKGLFQVHILFWNDIVHDLNLNIERLYQHYPQFKPKDAKVYENSHDQNLFKEFQVALSYNPAIKLLKDHDFGATFRRADIQPLYNFVETWDQPDKEFIDEELQVALTQFYRAAHDMAMHLVGKTVPEQGNIEFATVYPEYLRTGGPRPDHVIQDAKELNDNATVFVAHYEAFFRLCRKKLSI